MMQVRCVTVNAQVALELEDLLMFSLVALHLNTFKRTKIIKIVCATFHW
jgi:hypothetical protein